MIRLMLIAADHRRSGIGACSSGQVRSRLTDGRQPPVAFGTDGASIKALPCGPESSATSCGTTSTGGRRPPPRQAAALGRAFIIA